MIDLSPSGLVRSWRRSSRAMRAGIAFVTLVLLGCLVWALVAPDSGHTPASYEPTEIVAVEVCPSYLAGASDRDAERRVARLADHADHLAEAYCYPRLIVAPGPCASRQVGTCQIRACGDDPHGDGSPCGELDPDSGRPWVDAVAMRPDGTCVAWIHPHDALPGTPLHVVDHVVGIGHTTYASSHAASPPGLSDSGIPSQCR